MSRYHSYLNSATEILSAYKGEEPLSSFLKKFFAASKKYGSKDRKQISHLCYCYFRLGKAELDISIEERILIALFLCSNESNEILENLKPEWNENVRISVKEKCSMFNSQYSMFNVFFPWKDELSEGIDYEKFNESFFIQPDLFLRLRPGKEHQVKQKFQQAEIDFKEMNSTCLSLANTSKIENIIELNKEAVVQDYNSQQTGEHIRIAIANCQLPIAVWDCCAASGGKSIMAKDILGDIELTVSDIRESILINLKKRFSEAGIADYKSKVVDLTNSKLKTQNSKFDIVICDAPCTGSGTWPRTPEQLFYFEKSKIEEYVVKQKKIVSNTVPHLKPGGYLLYITCSVFEKENEDVVDFIKQQFKMKEIKTEVLKGYDKKADTMFAALLQKPL